jgi:hypothetical protein
MSTAHAAGEPGDQRATIAELRAAAAELLAGFDERGEAELLLATGVVLINEPHAALQAASAALDAGGAVDATVVRMMYVPSHECVHMVQLLTARCVLSTAFDLFGLAMQVNQHRRRGTPEAEWLPPVLDDYRALQQGLSARQHGCSTLEVIEAHAVLEGFRGFATLHGEAGLRWVLRLAHDGLPTYARLIESVTAAHGFELMFEVLPRLCWVALNADEPGRWLGSALQALGGEDMRHLAGLSAAQTCERFGMDPARAASSWRLRRPAVREHPMHGVLERYFDSLERETDVEVSLQRAMHPGRQPAGAQVAMRDLMPPLTVYQDNVWALNGPYRDDGWAAAEPLLRLSALVSRTLACLAQRDADR